MSKARIICWDWKAEPLIDDIAAAVKEISDGNVIMREIDTGGDNYAWIIADREVTDEEALELYRS